MENFNKCLPFIFEHEGYKSNDAADTGGLTIWGIAGKFYPNEVAEMAKMTPEAAKEVAAGIYYRNYWKPLDCDNYYPKISLALFDSAVNCGAQKVQQWVKTLTTPKGNIQMILTAHDILFMRQQYYLDIVSYNKTQAVFLRGWLQRTLDVWTYQL